MDLAVKKDDEVDSMDNDQLVAAMLRAKNERRRAESDVSTVVVGLFDCDSGTMKKKQTQGFFHNFINSQRALFLLFLFFTDSPLQFVGSFLFFSGTIVGQPIGTFESRRGKSKKKNRGDQKTGR